MKSETDAESFLDALPERHCFVIMHGKIEEEEEEGSSSSAKSLTSTASLRHNLCLFYLITRSSVYVQPITLSRLSQTDDVSNWKAWNTLEQPASHRNQPYFYLPRLAPKWRGSEEVCGGRERENASSLFFWRRNKEASFGGSRQFLLVSWLSVSHRLSSTAQG